MAFLGCSVFSPRFPHDAGKGAWGSGAGSPTSVGQGNPAISRVRRVPLPAVFSGPEHSNNRPSQIRAGTVVWLPWPKILAPLR